MADKTLSTAEKFLMIAHHPERGRFMVSGMFIQYGVTGAILLDMTLDGSLEMKDRKLLLWPGRVDDKSVRDDVAALMSASEKPMKTGFWVRKLARRYNRYLVRVLNEMEKKRLVRTEKRKFLGLIPYRKSFLVESYTRSNLIRQLKSDILSYTSESSPSGVAIACLIEACRMQRIMSSDRDELKTIRTQLKKIVKESPVSEAVGQTIREVQAAIMASVTAAVIAATAGGHH
ncbi:MAG: GPP34 family phosphoprotein [Bacteroidales bacterium]